MLELKNSFHNFISSHFDRFVLFGVLGDTSFDGFSNFKNLVFEIFSKIYERFTHDRCYWLKSLCMDWNQLCFGVSESVNAYNNFILQVKIVMFRSLRINYLLSSISISHSLIEISTILISWFCLRFQSERIFELFSLILQNLFIAFVSWWGFKI